MHNVGNHEEFSYIDNSTQYTNANEDCQEAIVEQITETHQKIRKPMRKARPSVNE